MERFFKVLLVLGIVLSLSSLYFLMIESIYAIFFSIFGVMIVGFSVFEIISLKKKGIVRKKVKPVASKVKAREDISWTYYDVNKVEKDRTEEEKIIEEHVKHTKSSKLLHWFKLRKEPKISGKAIEKELAGEKNKISKDGKKTKESQLKKYIHEALDSKVPKNEIIKACLQSGWPENKVNEVFNSLNRKKSGKKFGTFISLVVLTIFLSIGLMITGNFLIGYWLTSLKAISSAVYYSLLSLIVISVGIIIFDVKDKLTEKKKTYKIQQEETVSEIKGEMKESPEIVIGDGFSTDIDKLLELANKKSKLTVTEVAGIFNISKKEAEQWGKILKDEGLITLYYPTVGDVELRMKKKVKVKEE